MYDVSDLEQGESERHLAFAALRAADGLVHDAGNDCTYVARHGDVAEVSQHPEIFSSASGITYFDSVPLSFVTMDEPEHGRLRRIVSRQFTPKMVNGLRDRTEQYTAEAIESVGTTDRFELVDSVTAPVPLRVIADLLGIDHADLPAVRQWTDTMMDSSGRLEDPAVVVQAAESFGAWSEFVAAQVANRVSDPGDDLLSALAHADDETLDADELAMFASALMVAGNETTRYTSSRGIDVLLRHPDQLARLRADPSGWADATEEVLRWTSVARVMVRTVRQDTVLAGTTLAPGERVALLYPSANRDEAVFAEADRFLADRSPNPHLAFGTGTHYCLGANLARLEVAIIMRAVVEAFPGLALDPEAPMEERSNGLINGVSSLWVTT